MQNVLPFIKAHKIYAISFLIVFLFLLARLVLLQKPNTELTYTVKKENLVDTVQVSGTYTTAAQTQVASPTNGILSEIYVTNNQQVQKGDQLFHVESSATDDQKAAAYAAYLAASSALKADQATLYSLQSSMYNAWQSYMNQATNSTFQNGDGSSNDTNRSQTQFTVPQSAWLAAEQQFKNQQNVIAKDQAAQASAKLAYDETQSVTVKAQVAGTVVNLQNSVGDQVLATVTTAQQVISHPVLVIANLSNPYVAAAISEDYVPRIKEGQSVNIVFDGLKDKTFRGKVSRLDTVGTTAQGVVTYNARIESIGIPHTIKPNMTALITIETFRKNAILDVPNSAIITKDGSFYVVEANTNGKKRIPVELGEKGITKTEIIRGLEENTVIVANPNSQ